MAQAFTDFGELRKDLGRALKLLETKAPDYIKAREFYDGTRAEVSASKLVSKIIEKSAADMPVSFAHIPVDVVCEKVIFSGITAKDASADKLLTTVIDNNDLEDEVDRFLSRLEEASRGDDQIASYVHSLEEQWNEPDQATNPPDETADLPSADDILRDVEDFLRGQ